MEMSKKRILWRSLFLAAVCAAAGGICTAEQEKVAPLPGPKDAVGSDNFSVRWTGHVTPEFSEEYTFRTISDDGVRLWVDGVSVIDNWTDHPLTEDAGTAALTAGAKHELKMEYYESGFGATARLLWESPSRPREVIPSSRLSPGEGLAGEGLRGEYFNGTSFEELKHVRLDSEVNFDWQNGSPTDQAPPLAWAAKGQAAEQTQIPISFTMPEDGYVSLNILNAEGQIVRQLLGCEPFPKGEQTVAWDTLNNPHMVPPNKAVAPGEYTWRAIWHKGIGLRFKGWACHEGNGPWDISPTTYWGGDHALPTAVASDGKLVYLGWGSSEAGKAFVAVDLDGNVQWASGYHFNGCHTIACDSVTGDVYYCAGGILRRVDTADGKHLPWPGRDVTDLRIADLWGDGMNLPDQLTWVTQDGFAAHGGKLYLGFSGWTVRRSEITDWRKFFTQVTQLAEKKDPLAEAIWGRLGDRERGIVTKWLQGNQPEDEALKAPNTPDIRDVAANALAAMLSEKRFVEAADTMTPDQLAESNRRFIEKAFPDSLAPMQSNLIAVVDSKTLKLVKTIPVKVPGRIVAVSDDLFYVLSERSKVLALNPQTGQSRLVVEGLDSPCAVAADSQRNIYVSVVVDKQRWSNSQVLVYSPEGKLLRKIGEPVGHDPGPWNAYRLAATSDLTVDRLGRLWVAEAGLPKRFATFDARTGKLLKEYFGPTHYGASGGAVNPRDPSLLVGEGCEWRIDPKTGRAKLLGIITGAIYHGFARFCDGANGKQYLGVTFNGRIWGAGAPAQIRIYERLGEGDYAFRASIVGDQGKTLFWADADGDQKQQPEEVQSLPEQLAVGGYYLWSMNLNTDLTFYGTGRDKTLQVRVKEFTTCGAPVYDLKTARQLPPMQGPLSSPDNRVVLSVDNPWGSHSPGQGVHCYEVETGKHLWTYPSPWAGVHGSHGAPGPATGLIRGAFGIVGNATLPEPAGRIWAINTNVGEWHILTEDGFYLTRLFQPDSQKRKYPEKAVPGAVVDDIPPGLGGEDFGGSLIQAPDGRIYVQAGKTAVWSIEAVGFDTIKDLASGSLTINKAEALEAELAAGRRRQAEAKPKSLAIRKKTINAFTGDLNRDFGDAERLQYSRQGNAAVTTMAAWDDTHLYIGWEVKDSTPWLNGADVPEYMYTCGDTVDFQIALAPAADRKRGEAAAGDVRLSIGNLQGTATAVLFRPVAPDRKGENSRSFSSGVVEGYVVDSVEVLKDAKIEVRKRNDGYLVEAAIPLASLGLKLTPGFATTGDFGTTHGDLEGKQTTLRTFWSNQSVGIVDDDVFELKLQPGNWGELRFEE